MWIPAPIGLCSSDLHRIHRAYAGLAIICATALAISAVGFFVIGLWLKARLEEQFLSEEMGAAAYATYMTQTPMLVPRLPRPKKPRVAPSGAKMWLTFI